MKSILVLCFISLSFSISWASTYVRSNEYLDSLVRNRLSTELTARRLDPAILRDFNQEFRTKVTVFNVKVKAEYNDGKLSGLRSAHRLGDCGAPAWTGADHTQAIFSCALALDNLVVTYDGKAKYSKIPRANFKAKGTVKNANVRFALTMDKFGNFPRLIDFRIESKGAVKVSLDELGSLMAVKNSLKENFAIKVIEQIEDAIYNSLRPALETSVIAGGPIPMPIA